MGLGSRVQTAGWGWLPLLLHRSFFLLIGGCEVEQEHICSILWLYNSKKISSLVRSMNDRTPDIITKKQQWSSVIILILLDSTALLSPLPCPHIKKMSYILSGSRFPKQNHCRTVCFLKSDFYPWLPSLPNPMRMSFKVAPEGNNYKDAEISFHQRLGNYL